MADPKDWKTIGVIKPKTRAVNRKEARWAKDGAAYRRLRADGEQPAQIDGSAYLEQNATESIELEMGRVFKREEKADVRVGVEISSELGIRSPFDR